MASWSMLTILQCVGDGMEDPALWLRLIGGVKYLLFSTKSRDFQMEYLKLGWDETTKQFCLASVLQPKGCQPGRTALVSRITLCQVFWRSPTSRPAANVECVKVGRQDGLR